MMATPLELACGLAADFAFGDPRWLPHPVAGLGRLATIAEAIGRRSAVPLRLAGCGAWLLVVGLACAVVYGTLRLLPAPYIQIYWIYSLLAVRSLDDHAMAVFRALRKRDLPAARTAVARIVGRDTAELDEAGIARAALETVAENLNDGVIAPLFWLLLAGPVGMAGYKAINTLDSMFGYRNDRYREFGWASARMDDLAGWFPARLTAALIWFFALLWPGLSAIRSVKATLRDAHRQPSPNSGYPEAAAAGALGVQLGGTNFYGGLRTEKSRLGDAVQPLDWRAYSRMRALLYGCPLLFCAGALAWR